MPQYLVANYLPDDFDPSAVTEAMIEEIHALNREMIAAGARKFACGISPASNAKTVRKQPDGTVLVTDGPYTETKEHMGGFWILEAADMWSFTQLSNVGVCGDASLMPATDRVELAFQPTVPHSYRERRQGATPYRQRFRRCRLECAKAPPELYPNEWPQSLPKCRQDIPSARFRGVVD
jgi:hypothetical protein